MSSFSGQAILKALNIILCLTEKVDGKKDNEQGTSDETLNDVTFGQQASLNNMGSLTLPEKRIKMKGQQGRCSLTQTKNLKKKRFKLI
ncbi:hypothetical protein PoB_004334200 [Plakobranchus ocellatus]|uniref:Uncharacterized protein n=1 Tax=Plakobranchus ocellatus TaxID=259542 RepID=A0AAV4BBN8_9GAST|nr:hypothetical protein PoB_004334200 [Plakobranchus ocellatus]